MKVGIIGLGYVGLPLAVAFAEAGHDVVAIVTAHPGVDWERLVEDAALVIDFRGVTREITADNLVRL